MFDHSLRSILPIIAYIPVNTAFSTISAIGSILALIGALVIYIIGKDASKKKVVSTTLGLVCFCGVGIFIWLYFFNFPPPPPPPAHQWETAVQEFVPGCYQADNTTWKIDSDPSTVTCTGSGLSMQQTNRQGGAESDLDLINGSTYSQTEFHVQVAVLFQSASSDPHTMVELIVQTPSIGTGGFTFGLNNTGYWALQSVPTASGQQNQTVDSGSLSSLDLSKPITLEVDVQNNLLTGFINGQQVTQYKDTLNPPSSAVVGLVTDWSNGGSTSVVFRDFKLEL
jgi:hypothetical protein